VQPFVLIDGYNLMHAAGIARQNYGPGDLQRCRLRLNRKLCELLSAETLVRTAVIYDAFRSESDTRRVQNHGELRVIFAPKGTDADSVIERLLKQSSSPRQTLVVSSDHRLHKAARRRKASCIDSEDFWQEITSSADDSPMTPASSKPLPDAKLTDPSDLQSWAEAEQTHSDSNGPSDFDPEYLKQIEDELNS